MEQKPDPMFLCLLNMAEDVNSWKHSLSDDRKCIRMEKEILGMDGMKTTLAMDIPFSWDNQTESFLDNLLVTINEYHAQNPRKNEENYRILKDLYALLTEKEDITGNWMLISVEEREIMTEKFFSRLTAIEKMRSEMVMNGVPEDVFTGRFPGEEYESDNFGFSQYSAYINDVPGFTESDWSIVQIR